MWRVGILPVPMSQIVTGGLADMVPVWLPAGRAFTYLADPFGFWRGGLLHVFVEAYDYRTRRGGIDVLILDDDFAVVDHRPCLRTAWHLSYPFVFEADGETYMLPEANKSGALTLYRATHFPDAWEPVCDIALDGAPRSLSAVDATPFFFEGRWWLFYAPGTNLASMMGVLNVAYADRITGPWTPHPLNPLRAGSDGARPAGTPIIVDGAIVVPVQDCSKTYGGAVRALTIRQLSPDSFDADIGPPIVGGDAFAPYTDGFHTLSDCGNVTLFDAKQIDRSPGKWLVDAGRAPIVARKALKGLRARF